MKKILRYSQRFPKLWQLLTMATLLLLIFNLAPARSVHAATITVDGTTCALDDAITSANTDTATGGCTAGSGDDIIDLQANVTLMGVLPDISTTITLEGNGHTIDGGSTTFRVLNVVAPNGNLTLNNATITGGNTTDNGGGILNAGTLTVNNSTIINNNAAIAGGGILSTGNTAITTINNSTITDNTATNAGGGIGVTASSLFTITNSTISNNSTDGGGGGIVVSVGGILILNNSTVTGNSADGGSGGGGIIMAGTDSETTLHRSLISGNLASADPASREIRRVGGTMGGNDFNVIGFSGVAGTAGGSTPPSGSDIVPVGALDTVLNTTLADNGGPTQTHALVSGSPAINLVPGGQSGLIDQRGAARDFGGSGDAGAYEVRESITIGSCGGTDLSGPQNFNFTISGNTVTVDVDTANGLSCITVEEMGPGANHLVATGLTPGQALMTDNWWYITGNITSGFDVDITLPFVGADAESRVCKYPGNLGGFGWDCGDDTDNSAGIDTVTRVNVSSFSDWAVGDDVGPTAVTLQDISVQNNNTAIIIASILVMLLISYGVSLRRRVALKREA